VSENIISRDKYNLSAVICFITVLLHGSYFLVSCSDPIDVEDNINKIPVINDSLNKNGIKPLAKGMKWIYQFTEYDSLSTIVDSYIIIDSVLKDTIIDKVRWYKTTQYPAYWQGNLNDGLRFREYPQNLPIYEWLEAKYPGSIGFTWQANSSQRTIVSTDTSITVPAGQYICYYYSDIGFSQTNGWQYSNLFFSRLTGMIKLELYRERVDKTKYLSQKTELVTFIKED
jgi:hypothetical protein